MAHTWSATMITAEHDHQAPLLRTQFDLASDHGPVTAARWLVSAQGVFEAHLGGRPVSDDVLSPGWSSYEWRLRYRDYDVTAIVQATTGPIVLGLALGNGWHRGTLTWFEATNVYGDRLAAIAELEITFADGHRQVVLTDESWTSGPSAVLANDLYDGETIDGRLVPSAWLQPGFEDSAWVGVEPVAFDTAKLTPYVGPAGRAAGGACADRDLDLTQREDAGRLRPEPGRLAQGTGARRGRPDRHDPARRGARARRVGRPAVAQGQGHRPLHPVRRRRRVRADLHLPRVPLRRGRRLAGRADAGVAAGGRGVLRPDSDG